MQILKVAAQAITDQYNRLGDSAKRVAKAGDPNQDPPTDLVRETVTRIESDAAIRANLAVIRSEDERTKSLINTVM